MLFWKKTDDFVDFYNFLKRINNLFIKRLTIGFDPGVSISVKSSQESRQPFLAKAVITH